MPGEDDLAPIEKIHTLPFVPPVFYCLHQTCIHSSEFLRPKLSLPLMIHTEAILRRIRLVTFLTGWGTRHLKFTITVWTNPGDKNDHEKVLTQLETYFKLAQNIYHCWYMLGGLYSSQFKSQSDFMIKLRDVVKDCQFKRPDEIVKFLFLTHNQNPKVREELLKSMKDGDGLNDILGYARLVEGAQHSEHLSKVYLESVKNTSKGIKAIDKKDNIKNKKFHGGNSKSRQNSKYRSKSKDKKGCHNCGSKHAPKHCPAFGKECYHCKKKNHFSNMCRGRQHSQSCQRSQSQNSRFSRKDHHELKSRNQFDDSKWYSYE